MKKLKLSVLVTPFVNGILFTAIIFSFLFIPLYSAIALIELTDVEIDLTVIDNGTYSGTTTIFLNQYEFEESPIQMSMELDVFLDWLFDFHTHATFCLGKEFLSFRLKVYINDVIEYHTLAFLSTFPQTEAHLIQSDTFDLNGNGDDKIEIQWELDFEQSGLCLISMNTVNNSSNWILLSFLQ